MRVLVTGGTGFVGGHLIHALLERGDVVTALVRSPEKAARLPARVRTVAGDLHDQEALAEAVAGQELIYHVAGLVAARSELEFMRSNREGTATLVAAAQREGALRFLLVSSMAAGGPAAPGRPKTADDPADPVTAYGRSKLAAETVVTESSLRWTIVRPPMVYGPGDTEVYKVFRLALRGFAPVFGRGTQELSAVTGPDLASAMIAAATAPATTGQLYYPCHPEIFTSSAFARAVGRALDKDVRVIPLPGWLARGALTVTGAGAGMLGRATILNRDKANEFLQPAWTGDPAPLTEETGWQARYDLASGLAMTAAWYRREGWL